MPEPLADWEIRAQLRANGLKVKEPGLPDFWPWPAIVIFSPAWGLILAAIIVKVFDL